jgi:hypothetical protein
MSSRNAWLALWLLFAGSGALGEIKAGDRVILGRSAAFWYRLHEGVWTVQAVDADGRLVVQADDGHDYVLKARDVSPVVRSDIKRVILSRNLRRDLRAGVWHPVAVSADGLVVLQAGIRQYVVPPRLYERVDEKGPKQIALRGITYSLNSGLRLQEGIWHTVATGVAGTAVVETLSGSQQVVRSRDYRAVVSSRCRWKDL